MSKSRLVVFYHYYFCVDHGGTLRYTNQNERTIQSRIYINKYKYMFQMALYVLVLNRDGIGIAKNNERNVETEIPFGDSDDVIRKT